MQLFFTDATFIYQGLPRPKIPFLCNADMQLLAEPNEYLRYISIIKGRTRSPKTWRTYASHLYEFFAYLELNQTDWHKVDLAVLATWRDTMLARGCARSTANQRLRCVEGFYTWGVQSKMIAATPFSSDLIRVSKHRGMLAHVDASGGKFSANVLTMQTPARPLAFLILADAIRFLDSLGPLHLKLMSYLALLTGMRREEVTSLSYRVFPNPCGHDPSKQLPMTLDERRTPTKGMKTRTVMVPYDLAVVIWNYFCVEWPKRNARHTRHYGQESARIFLSENGHEFSDRYLNNAFAKAVNRTGIQCHPHMLRHTYGTYEFLRMTRKYGQDRALLWLRERMGHASITTTEVYVHAAELLTNHDIDDYQTEILGVLSHGN